MKLFLTILLVGVVTSKERNNVCTTLIDYLIIDASPNCHFNPDIGEGVDGVAIRYDYPFEEHRIVTEDGYYLSLMRLPQKGPPILLQHGILSAAGNFLLIGKNSPAFVLYDAGYDVWLGNFRGNYYSNEHVNNNITKEEYWNFSFHEMGYYDIPVMIDFIVNTTSTNQKIIYIGHSMGTTASYVYSILRKEHAEKHLSALISLAPIANIQHIRGAFELAYQVYPQLEILARIFGIYSVGTHTPREQTDLYESCLYGLSSLECVIFVNLLLEPAPETIPAWITQTLKATSLKILIHYAQIIANQGRFQFFDYGSRNVEIYHSKEPPAYNISQIGLPVHLFYGRRDALSEESDVFRFYHELNTTKSIRRIAEHDEVLYNHPDFVSSPQIDYLYQPLFRVLQEIQNVTNN